MVSALDSGASGSGSSPGRGHCVVFLGKPCTRTQHNGHFTLTMPRSTQVYKWVPANFWGNLTKFLGSDLRWTSIPFRGGRNTSSRFMLQNTRRDKLRQLWARFGSKPSLTFVCAEIISCNQTAYSLFCIYRSGPGC